MKYRALKHEKNMVELWKTDQQLWVHWPPEISGPSSYRARPSVVSRDEWLHYWMLDSSAPSKEAQVFMTRACKVKDEVSAHTGKLEDFHTN